MNFKDFNFILNTNTNKISINDKDINILQYLPIVDKYDLIQLVLQNAEENGIYNILKVDMFFELYLIYMYTDIQFTLEEKADPTGLYDTLKSTGALDVIIQAIPEKEYSYLLTALKAMIEKRTAQKSTLAATLNGFIENLPINAEKALETLNKFNPEDFRQVMQFVQAANGNRPIN